MRKSNLLRSWVAGLLVISSLTMCHKKEKEAELRPESGNMRIASVSTCTYTIQPTQQVVDGSSIPAGSVVCIPAGTRGQLTLKNFKGTPASPVIFINKGGKVVFKVPSTGSFAIKTDNCSNFKLTGDGDPSVKYGIEIDGSHNGIALDKLSTDFEVSNLEVHNCGFAGIMAKTDPSCDSATWRGHFVMKNISIHDNYVHHTTGEGFYIGNSFYQNGMTQSCGQVFPHEIWGAKIFNNITEYTGCEGIQVSCVTKNCEINNNIVSTYGQSPFASGQNNGIQIGGGNGGKCYNNLVKNGPGVGIICFGLGDNLVYNNFIVNAGTHGIFADSRYTPGPNFQFINNTIIEPGADGIRLYSETIPMNTVINNAIIRPGSGKGINKKSDMVKLTASNNFIDNDISNCKFLNSSGYDFKLASGSMLIDAGADVSSLVLLTDFYNAPRLSGKAYDIGATEYQTDAGSGTSQEIPPVSNVSLSVTSFTLINAVTGKEIGTIANGAIIDLMSIGTNRLSVRANTNPGTVGSVVFGYDARASFRIENGAAPYTLMGDYPNNIYTAWIPSVGKHTITATPYSQANGAGTQGSPLSVTVTVK